MVVFVLWSLLHVVHVCLGIHYGDDYNGTHVLVEGRYFKVVNCQYENSSSKYIPDLPIVNYKDTILHQAFFTNRFPHYRFSCRSKTSKCSCVEEPENPLGYRCICPYKTSFFYRYFYDDTKKFEGRCEKFSTLCGKCQPRNTFKCIIINATAVRCQCFRGYEPTSNCFDKYNACDKASEGFSLSGNEACGVADKNKCLPSIGFQKYICQCFYPNKEDYSIGFPNCMGKKVKKCDSILCINGGFCDSNGECKCKKGYSGKYCEIIQYKYTGSWTSWTSCYPECGNYGLRSSEAVCDGPINIFCSGVIRKWERCAAVSCGLRFLSSVQNRSIDGLRYYMYQMLTLTQEESITLSFILSLGGIASGLIYIVITELMG